MNIKQNEDTVTKNNILLVKMHRIVVYHITEKCPQRSRNFCVNQFYVTELQRRFKFNGRLLSSDSRDSVETKSLGL